MNTIAIIAGVAVSLALIFIPTKVQYIKQDIPTVVPPVTMVAKKPEVPKAALDTELIPICTCESGQGTGKPQQFDIHTGAVLHGAINPNDIGMCQINLKYHRLNAEKMGFDLFTEQGNIKYANWLYEHKGSKPWAWSKSCWAS